jgi:hypothetical protein
MPGEGQIQPAHDPGFATTPSGPGAYQEPDLGYDQPPPRGDDDIPF